MIVNPIVAAAAVAARAFTPFASRAPANRSPEPPLRDDAFPTSEYYDADVVMEENDVMFEQQAMEFEDFVAGASPHGPPFGSGTVQDAEILSKERTADHPLEGSSRKHPQKPPPLPDTVNPLTLLGLDAGANFDDVRRAYKRMVKVYHPDAVVGPDASFEERRVANEDFVRINEAYDKLKRREEEEVYEYSMYVDGEKVTKRVVMSDESRRRDPYSIDYDRIHYGNRRPRERMWYEEEHDYQTRHNGFDGDASTHSNPFSRGKWWGHSNCDPIPSNERMWDERHAAGREGGGSNGFGPISGHDQWWNERHPFGQQSHRNTHDNEYEPGNGRNFEFEVKQGYPYKHKEWNERLGSDMGPGRTVTGATIDYDHGPGECFSVKEKWWKEVDPAMSNFAP